MEAPPDALVVSAGLYLVRAAWAPSVATTSEKNATRTANACMRERRTTYGTTAMTPSLSGAYGVSCRARAERAALGPLTRGPLAPGHQRWPMVPPFSTWRKAEIRRWANGTAAE